MATCWIWQRAACWGNTPFKYVMSTSHESITLTKYSPRRQGICRRIKDNTPCTSGRIGVRTMCHTRWTIQLDVLGSIISNCVVLQSMWNYAKDVDRARYGDEGKNSRRFVSYEHIPLPVRYHVSCFSSNSPTTWAELCNTSRVFHECQQVASMTVETLTGIRGDEHYTFSGQRWPAKRELSTWVNLRYLEEEKRPCDLMIGCAKETLRKRSQWYHRRLHPGPARPTWTFFVH